MQSGRLAALLDRLTTRFDWIVIDSPPVLPLADTSVWARFTDGVLLVAREGTSKKRELQRGLRALESSHLLGVVLNSCAPTDQSNYYQRYQAGRRHFQALRTLTCDQQALPCKLQLLFK